MAGFSESELVEVRYQIVNEWTYKKLGEMNFVQSILCRGFPVIETGYRAFAPYLLREIILINNLIKVVPRNMSFVLL